MWRRFNHFKMRYSASRAHHSRLVDFGERSSRPLRAMCTSSIVHACAKALPFFKSGHVCHLIVLSPPALFLSSSTVCFWCDFAAVGLS